MPLSKSITERPITIQFPRQLQVRMLKGAIDCISTKFLCFVTILYEQDSYERKLCISMSSIHLFSKTQCPRNPYVPNLSKIVSSGKMRKKSWCFCNKREGEVSVHQREYESNLQHWTMEWNGMLWNGKVITHNEADRETGRRWRRWRDERWSGQIMVPSKTVRWKSEWAVTQWNSRNKFQIPGFKKIKTENLNCRKIEK